MAHAARVQRFSFRGSGSERIAREALPHGIVEATMMAGDQVITERHCMSTVQEIVTAASQLGPDEFVLLREELDRLEEQLWKSELKRTTEEMREAGITDEMIDEIVVSRRRESRS